MKIKTASLSDPGGRKINDDTVRIQEVGGSVCIFVGDGLGGYAGGQQASQAAGAALMAAGRQGSLMSDTQLLSAVQKAELAVRTLQENTHGNMKTTLVFLVLEGNRARWTHVGDSRLYHFQNGKLAFQTMDHSVSQMAVLMGDITLRQIRFHEDRNRVLRALGGDNAKPDLSPVLTLSGGQDAFLLCTDGFWEYVYEEEMEQTLAQSRNPKDWLQRMERILRSRIPADNDNYTAAALFC